MKQVLVGKFGGFEFGHGFGAKQEATKGGEPKLRTAPVISQPGKNQAQAYPEVGVPASASALRHPAQPLAAVETRITRPGVIGGAREVEQIPVFGHEEEDQPVDQPKQLAVEVLLLQFTGLETLAEILVCLMRDESGAEVLKSLLDTDAKLVECPTPVCLCLL